MLATLLLDSRGLLTLSPMLIMGALGTVLLYKRGRRAEALTIGGICLCYLGYNSGYYLPFGGGFMGPRFLTTMLPFLAFPIALALKRLPGPTIALAAVSITTTVIATITHPLVGYETETVMWARYLREGLFQPTIASAYGLGRGWGGIWPFLLAAGGGRRAGRVGDPTPATVRGDARAGACSRWSGGACSRARARPCSGSTTRACASIYNAGDHTALNLTAALRQPISAEDARADRRARRPAGPRARCDCCATQPTAALAPARGSAPAPPRRRSRPLSG